MTTTGDHLSQASRYRRRPLLRRVSWVALIIGVLAGLVGGFYIAWVVSPVVEVNTAPHQLRGEDRAAYVVGVGLGFSQDNDIARASQRLLTVLPQADAFAQVANIACDLSRSGYADDAAGLRAVRSLITFYQTQGQTGCADTLVGLDAPAPTAIAIVLTPATEPPIPTKTATPAPTGTATTPTPVPVLIPTSAPQQQFALVNVATFCDADASGRIEVFVQDITGVGLPGQPVRVRWNDGEDIFFTGLKPDEGAGYADFDMTEDVSYTVDMPGLSAPSSSALVAVPCNTADGAGAITSYRVVFRPEA